jgi:nitrous oxidase accessory protein NosD
MTQLGERDLSGVLVRRADQGQYQIQSSGLVSGRRSGIQIDVGSTGASIYNNSINTVRAGIYLINAAAAVENNIVLNASERRVTITERSGG